MNIDIENYEEIMFRLLEDDFDQPTKIDLLRQIEHVLSDLHILDFVEVFLLIPDFVRVAVASTAPQSSGILMPL